MSVSTDMNYFSTVLGGGHGRGVERNGPARQGERANDPVRKEADAGVSHVDQGAALRHPPGSTPPEEPLRRWRGGGPQHPARSTRDPRLSASGGLRRQGPRMASSVSCHFGGQAPRWNLAAASTSAQRRWWAFPVDTTKSRRLIAAGSLLLTRYRGAALPPTGIDLLRRPWGVVPEEVDDHVDVTGEVVDIQLRQ